MNKKNWINEKKKIWDVEKCDNYDQGIGEYAKARDTKIITELLKGEKGKLLDIPCGSGRFTEAMQKIGFEVISADYSEDMISSTQKKYNTPSVRADIYNLPFKDKSINNIMVIRLIFHYPEPREIIRELKRVTKKDGVIILNTLNKYSIRWPVESVLKLVKGKKKGSIWLASMKEFTKLIEEEGLKVEKIKSAYILPTRAYNYLPKIIIRLVDLVEKIFPNQLKVVTFWKIRT